MFYKLSLCILVFGLSLSTAYAGGYKKMYKVTVKNLTTGQPLTPVVIAIHSPHYKMINLGEKASKGLAALAKDGVTKALEKELAGQMNVVRTKTGTGVILPGKSESHIVKASNSHFKISLVSMLARTNDAISVLDSASLMLRKGKKMTYLTSVYDAGVELNTESCLDIPAPPCGSHNVGKVENSFIRPHAGVQLIGDLDAHRDTFASKVSMVTIERIQ